MNFCAICAYTVSRTVTAVSLGGANRSGLKTVHEWNRPQPRAGL